MIRRSRFKQPIVIKRVINIEPRNSNTHWKVAYADFVTAMMAFFLLLWLINATTPQQKMVIAEYFTPTVGLKDGQGVGLRGGKRSMEEGGEDSIFAPVGLVAGAVRKGSAQDLRNSQQTRDDPTQEEAQRAIRSPDAFTDKTGDFRSVIEGINEALREDPTLEKVRNSLQVRDTPEGLKIDIIDDPKNLIFRGGTAVLTQAGEDALRAIVKIIIITPNIVSIDGHMEAGRSYTNPRYSSWELSADRANAVRKFLETTELEPQRISRVVGHGDKEPMLSHAPSSSRNRRVTVLLIRDAYMRVAPEVMTVPRGFLTAPEIRIKKEAEETFH